MTVASSSVRMNAAVHQALLREMRRLRAAVAGVDLGDHVALAGIELRWEFFAAQLADHHEKEDQFLWPQVEPKVTAEERVVLNSMEAEHEALHDTVSALTEAMVGLSEEADREMVLARWDDLELVLAGHCLHEEEAGVPILKKYLAEANFEQLLHATRSQTNSAITLAWVCDGAPETVSHEVWRLLPVPRRLFARPRGRRKYRVFTQECGF